MNNKSREVLIERFEAIYKASDDCVSILSDSDLTTEDLKNKLYPRFDRINDEMQVLEGLLRASFIEIPNSIQSSYNGGVIKTSIISI